MSYFLVCNANRNAAQFDGKLSFSEVMIPYRWDSSWIPQKISEMISLLNTDNIPEGHFSCKNCAYAKQRATFEQEVDSFIKEAISEKSNGETKNKITDMELIAKLQTSESILGSRILRNVKEAE